VPGSIHSVRGFLLTCDAPLGSSECSVQDFISLTNLEWVSYAYWSKTVARIPSGDLYAELSFYAIRADVQFVLLVRSGTCLCGFFSSSELETAVRNDLSCLG